jgi:hypothetical protein
MTDYGAVEDKRLPLLWRLFHALLYRLLEELRPEAKPNAAMLNVARAFLRDNRITAENRPDLRNGLRELAKLTSLPFDPPPEDN